MTGILNPIADFSDERLAPHEAHARSGRAAKVIGAAEAETIQRHAPGSDPRFGDNPVEWSVHRNSPDFPGKVIARPWLINADPMQRHKSAMLNVVLAADTLDELRALLPGGLAPYRPRVVTDRTLVEVWHETRKTRPRQDAESNDGDQRVATIVMAVR